MLKLKYLFEICLLAALLSVATDAAPDIYISEFSTNPETPTQGSPVMVRIGVYNQGTSASGPFTVQWWPGENYGAPACSWTLDGMVARGGQILTCTYEGYPSWYGKINTKVVADPAGAVAESDESNNVYKKSISVSKPGSAPSGGSSPSGGSAPSGSGGVSGSPDLFISEFSMTPETPTQGSPVTVRVGVYNKGNSASGPFTVQWWPGENYGAPACSWTLDGMVARGGQILTCTYEGYPSWYGKINTKVVADPAGTVAESDESNNVYKKTISVSKPGSAPSGGSSPSGGSAPSGSGGVSGSPDLFISEFSMTPETPTQGSPVTVRVGVYNKGNSASGPFTVQWWPGENYGAPACSWTLDGMVARGGQILTCTYEGYPSWYAKIDTKVVADPAGEVAESDESNNVYKKTISVSKPGSAPSDGSAPPGGSSPSWSESQIGSEDSAPPSDSASSGGFAPPGSSGVSGSPDLFISEFSMTPETPTQGSPVTVRVGVYNKGNSASGPFTVQWWPGENYGAPACSWTLDGMVARGGRILTCTYEGYPSWYAKINTKVVADPTSEVAESDESNNVYKKTISVNRP